MAEVILGKAPPIDAPERDAIHVAVKLLVAGEELWVGDDVKLAYGTTNVGMRADRVYKNSTEIIGIVDPFLKERRVSKDQRFYCLLMPNSVTGMRHHWYHPAFDGYVAPKIEASELWIRQFCDRWNFDYDELIQIATSALTEQEGDQWDRSYIVAQGRDLHSADELGPDHDLFWAHLEALTGKEYDSDHRSQMGWSCTC